MAQFAAIGIVSRDLARSAAFYRLLGVDVPDPDGDHLDVTLPSGVRLMWDDVELIRKLDSEWRPAEGGPAVVLAFECVSPGEVDKTHARVVAAGFESKKTPYDAFWGQRYATVLDPDGNAVDLFASL
jgi:Glyoxalase/Bleomycin resistance protein/Dioxygenase superfamily.